MQEGWQVAAHFDEVEWRNYFAWVRGKGVVLPADPMALMAAEGPAGPSAGPALIPAHASDTAWSAEKTIDFLRATRPDRPWVLHCGFFRPHPPFAAPAPWHEAAGEAPPAVGCADLADGSGATPADGALAGAPSRSSYFQGAWRHGAAAFAAELDLTRRAYYGLIAEVDDAIGRVLAALEETGQADDTLVVFTADHGEQLGDHGLLGKLGWFDQSYHLPLIFAGPGIPGDTRVDAFTEAVDLMPTLLDWLDLSVPRACDGVPLTPWLRGETPGRGATRCITNTTCAAAGRIRAGRPSASGVDEAAMCAMRTAEWKYVHFAALPPVLYDLRADPRRRATWRPTRLMPRCWRKRGHGCCPGAYGTPTGR